MTYVPQSPVIGIQPIANSSTTKNHPLGMRVTANSPTYGGGEFVYLLGVASTVVGSPVTYNPSTWQTTLLTDTANQKCPVAFAMSACVENEYGWYQVSGKAVARKAALKISPNVPLYVGAGLVTPTSASGKAILGAYSANLATVASVTTTILVNCNAPHMEV